MASVRLAVEGLRSSKVSNRLERTGAGANLQPLHPLACGFVSLPFLVASLARERGQGTSAALYISKDKRKARKTCHTYQIGSDHDIT